MSHLVFARKYRPSDFDSVTGQDQVTKTLKNAISRNKIAHAYLFCGPRGVGKTSVARIFSKALNCVKGPTTTPCRECANCEEITLGSSLSVREIDGASHNSVENVRELIDSFRAYPSPGYKFKVYIIDEVHMLSIAAFNALLKSLEEPPPQTIFILATTEVHKIPDTIISRCQRHDFRAIIERDIEAKLRSIVKEEKLKAEESVLKMIARISDGSMRDAESLLERVRTYAAKENHLSQLEAAEVLGVAGKPLLIDLSRAIFDRDSESVLDLARQAFSRGVDTALFLSEFVRHYRELLLAKYGGAESLKKIEVLESDIETLCSQVEKIDLSDMQDLARMAREGADSAIRSAYPQYAFEALIVRMATREPLIEIEKITKLLLARSGSSVKSGSMRESGSQDRAKDVIVNKKAPYNACIESWADFVDSATGSNNGIFFQQLRRLYPVRFEEGKLEAEVPDNFSAVYFQKDENKKKLEELLASNTATASWTVTIRPADLSKKAFKPEIKKDRRADENEEATELLEHPAIQRIQEAFPGSKVAGIFDPSKSSGQNTRAGRKHRRK